MKSSILSICIPTYNRPGYLMEAVESVFSTLLAVDIEIIISNNASTESYSRVEALLEVQKSKGWSITYINQKHIQHVDLNMFEVIKRASSQYVYLLGDDDYFNTPELVSLVNSLKAGYNPDVVFYNGIMVDSENKTMGNHFKLEPVIFRNVNRAYNQLRDKGTFGSLLVRKSLYTLENFNSLVGTKHAYGCFWITMLNDQKEVFIEVSNFPLVYLRHADKTYNILQVYLQDIIYESYIYQTRLMNPKALSTHFIYHKKILNRIRGVQFISERLLDGSTLSDFRRLSPMISNDLKFKINYVFAFALYVTKIYALAKRIYRR